MIAFACSSSGARAAESLQACLRDEHTAPIDWNSLFGLQHTLDRLSQDPLPSALQNANQNSERGAQFLVGYSLGVHDGQTIHFDAASGSEITRGFHVSRENLWDNPDWASYAPTLTRDEVRRVLRWNLHDLGASESQLRTSHEIVEYLFASSEQSALKRMASLRDSLSDEEKLLFIKGIGGLYASLYDFDRRDAMLSAQGEITSEQLRTNTRNYLSGSYDRSGICRGISLAQARLAKALGFKSSFVVSYGANKRLHTNIFSWNPDNPNQITAVNYDTQETHLANSADSTLSEYGRVRNVGSSAQIWSAEGRILAEYKTQSGEAILQALLVPGREINPSLNRTRSQLQAQVPLIESEGQTLDSGVSSASLANGQSILILPLSYRYQSDDQHFRLDTGLAYSHQSGDSLPEGFQESGATIDRATFTLGLTGATQDLIASPAHRLEGHSTLRLLSDYSIGRFSTFVYPGSVVLEDSVLDYAHGVEAEVPVNAPNVGLPTLHSEVSYHQHTPGSPLTVDTRVQNQSVVGVTRLGATTDLGNGNALALGSSWTSAETAVTVRNSNGEAYRGEASVTWTPLNDSQSPSHVRANLGADWGLLDATLGFEGALNGTPRILPGSVPALTSCLGVPLGDLDASLTLQNTVPLVSERERDFFPVSTSVQIQGSFTYRRPARTQCW